MGPLVIIPSGADKAFRCTARGGDSVRGWCFTFGAWRVAPPAPRRLILSPSDEEHMALNGQIEHLSIQHKKIQDIIEAEMANPDWDELRVAALKKQKLRIKDELERLRGTAIH
jgi:hypothetical protein